MSRAQGRRWSTGRAGSRDEARYVILGRPAHDQRPPLPAGHPMSWGAITAGTMLAGSAYLLPVFEEAVVLVVAGSKA